MKKIIFNLIGIFLVFLIILVLILSTIGIETNKFNKLISTKVSQTKNINLNLDNIKFKIDLKKLSLFLETNNPKISYRSVSIPIKNIRAYIDFLSLIKTNPKIEKTNLILEEIDITQLNKLSKIIKPSNFKSILNNKIKNGKLNSEIELFLTDQGQIKNYIAKGTVKNLEAELANDIYLKKTNLGFFADKSDILIKNIFGDLEDIKITDGDIKLNLEYGVKINSNFNSSINFNEKLINKYSGFINNFEFVKNFKNLKAKFNNNLSIDLDNTYKIKNYNFSISGKIDKSKLELIEPLKNSLVSEKIKTIYLSNLKIKSIFTPNNKNLTGNGKYSLNDSDFLNINFDNTFAKDFMNIKLNFDYKNNFELDFINYKKPPNQVSNFQIDFEKKKNSLNINKIYYEEGNNLIKIDNFKFKNKNLLSFKKIEVKTSNNDFIIQNSNKIIIKGKKFDGTNLAKFLNEESGDKKFKQLNSEIEIEFKNIKVPMSETLQNFRLIGEIQKGKFVKISSKGEFGGGNFLDITMKNDKKTNKKFLEIYSDLTRPLLTEYSFFKGLSGGKLLFSSIIDNNNSASKLKIEKFKVINAPGVIKLLSLADLGGLADLAEGEGLSFDILEIDMEKNKKFLKINEILALGPSMSVLMEGYQDENGITSLRGTLVPAKTLNKLISKIPVIGDIIIPKEVGEGLFGISFKMKGPKGKIKTSINPIKTITPRFIQKIIEKNKEAK